MNNILILIIVIIIFIIILFIDYNYCIEGFITNKDQYSAGLNDKEVVNTNSLSYINFKNCLDSLRDNSYMTGNLGNDVKMKTYFDTETIEIAGEIKKPIWFKYDGIYYKNPHAKFGINYNILQNYEPKPLKDVYYCSGLETCPDGEFRDTNGDCKTCPIDAYCNDNTINYCSPKWDDPLNKSHNHDLKYSPKRTFSISRPWKPHLDTADKTKQIKTAETHRQDVDSVSVITGATSASNCKCPLNYIPIDNSQQCVYNNSTTCSGDNIVYQLGGGGHVECVCEEGTIRDATGHCLTCPTNQVAGVGGGGVRECLCQKGYGRSAAGDSCTICPVGQYKDTDANSACTACPANSITLQKGGAQRTDCVCKKGYGYNDADHSCTICPVGQYKDTNANSACTACPAKSITLQKGGTQRTDCLCEMGYGYSADDYCTLCPAGKYKDTDSNTECKNCPADTYSNLLGRFYVTDCNPCPANSSSAAGSGTATNCSCNLGYTGSVPNCRPDAAASAAAAAASAAAAQDAAAAAAAAITERPGGGGGWGGPGRY